MRATPTEYGSLVSYLHERAAKAHQPLDGCFELSSACNLKCHMCYVREPGSERRKHGRELSAAQWLDLARQAKDAGLLFLLLTGGEIFLRPDFFELYEPLTRMGLVITLFTNGTLITPAIAARLAQSPPSRLEITLYGGTPETYDAVTGVKGGFESCCAGIEALLAHRIPLGLKTTLSERNIHELETMRKMAHDWGVPFNGAWYLSQRPDGAATDVETCRLSPAACVELEATDPTSTNEMRQVASAGQPLRTDDNFYCKVGRTAFVINPYGKMNACLLLPEPEAPALEIGFKAAWEQLVKFVDDFE